jgi:GNAT superfamily N-acetyltransferase
MSSCRIDESLRATGPGRNRDYDFPVIVREATAADDTALQALAVASPDGGAVTFRREHHVPAEQIPSAHEISEYFVAEIDGVIAGAALLNLGTCRFEGEDARYALLDGLKVHPAYRRRGVARRLTDRRLERASELGGDEAVTVAYIQAGNTASLANARRWATRVGGRLVVAMTSPGAGTRAGWRPGSPPAPSPTRLTTTEW